jgi:hypothetical protein
MAYIGNLAELAYIVQNTGKLQGKTAYLFSILGRRMVFTSNTLMNDVVEFGTAVADIPVLAGNETLEVVSSSGSDVVAGTGARKIKITYLNSSNAITESGEITLTGATPVNPVIAGAKAILWMEVTEVGSGGVSAGTITLRVAGPGAAHEAIVAGGNKSKSGRFTVPAGFDAYVLNWSGAAINRDQDIRLRANVNSLTRTIAVPFHFQDTAYLATVPNGTGIYFTKTLSYLKYPPLSVIKISTIVSDTAGSPRVDVGMDLLLVSQT